MITRIVDPGLPAPALVEDPQQHVAAIEVPLPAVGVAVLDVDALTGLDMEVVPRLVPGAVRHELD